MYVAPGLYGRYWRLLGRTSAVMPSSDILAGTISISDILKSLIWNGVITGQEYLSGVEFGPEPGCRFREPTCQQPELSMGRYPHHRVDCRK